MGKLGVISFIVIFVIVHNPVRDWAFCRSYTIQRTRVQVGEQVAISLARVQVGSIARKYNVLHHLVAALTY